MQKQAATIMAECSPGMAARLVIEWTADL